MEAGLTNLREGRACWSGSRCCWGPGSGRKVFDPVDSDWVVGTLCGYVELPAHWCGNCWQRDWLCLKAVVCCRRVISCSEGAAPLTKLVLGTVGTSADVAIELWTARRWSRTLLMWVRWVVLSLRCCESLLIWHLSLADCSSCWPSLVDSMAKEHSVDPLVVMVIIVVTRDTVFFWVVPYCSGSNWVTFSPTGSMPRANGPGR